MRHRRTAWFLCLLLTVILLAAVVVPAYANVLDQKLQEQTDLNRRLTQERQTLQQQRSREEALRNELSRLDRNIRTLEAELARLATEIARVAGEIAVTEEELADAQQRLEHQDNLLKSRLRAMYQHGNVSYLEVLLGASSFGDFLTRLYNLQVIAENDQRLLEEVREERGRIEAEKEKLEQKKSELEGMRRQTAARQEEVERTLASRAKVHEELQVEIARRESAIQEMEQEAAFLAALIKELLKTFSGNFHGITGSIVWPVEASSYITSGYGMRRNPFTRAWQFHGGIDIGGLWNRWPLSAGYSGSPAYILAADSGRVVFSGISEGGGIYYQKAPGRDEFRYPQYWTHAGAYGSLIIIDHGRDTKGDRWSTVYAHCHSRLVAAGDVVHKGQRIGIVGSTGSSTGPHLHFEVRRNDNRVDPMPFFR